MRHTASSFPPIATKKSHTLILGSMPGVKSLAERQYYAHPQNMFWKILSALFDSAVETYPQRVRLIEKNGLALWDVLKCCERHGSLDMRIDDATIEVNDFAAFFAAHPKITRVFLNGGKAEKEFMKRVWPELPEKIRARIAVAKLPSTSPANAGIPAAKKMKAWSQIKVI